MNKTNYKAVVLKDSVAPGGQRLTTLEITFPRIVLPELNTHRAFSRNSASSRAIPVEKMIKRVEEDPFVPEYWGVNQRGMVAEEDSDEESKKEAIAEWLMARDNAVASAKKLMQLNMHKQITNRLLEPFMWHTVIVSATEWDNWDALRTHADAQPEIRRIAIAMKEARNNSNPVSLNYGELHLPLVDDVEELKAAG